MRRIRNGPLRYETPSMAAEDRSRMSSLDVCRSYFRKLEMSKSDEFDRTLEGLLQALDINCRPTASLIKDELVALLSRLVSSTASVSDHQAECMLNTIVAASAGREMEILLWVKLFRYWISQDPRPRSALVVVDVQNDFISGSMALRECPARQNGEDVVPVINTVRSRLPFDLEVLVKDHHPPDHISFLSNVHRYQVDSSSPISPEDAKLHDTLIFLTPEGLTLQQTLWPAHCVQASWGEEFHPDLKIKSTDHIVVKGTHSWMDSYSAFWDNNKRSRSSLLELLLDHGVTHVYICGLALDYCVKFTALHAAELGFNSIVIEDACRGIADETIAQTREELLRKGCVFVSSEELIEGSLRSALSDCEDPPPRARILSSVASHPFTCIL